MITLLLYPTLKFSTKYWPWTQPAFCAASNTRLRESHSMSHVSLQEQHDGIPQGRLIGHAYRRRHLLDRF